MRTITGLLVSVVAFAVAAPVSAQLVTNLNRYTTITMGTGAEYFGDRTFTIVAMPFELQGVEGIQTLNDDKGATDPDWLQFDLTENAFVWIAYDNRAFTHPDWMADFDDTGQGIVVSDSGASPHNLFRKKFDAGPVTLGGNFATGAAGADSNYFVLVTSASDFLAQPIGGFRAVGASHTFSVELRDPVGTPTYQWQKDQVDIPGATDASLTLGPLDFSDTGFYRCVVNDGSKAEFISAEAFLEVVAEVPAVSSWFTVFIALILGAVLGGAIVYRRTALFG